MSGSLQLPDEALDLAPNLRAFAATVDLEPADDADKGDGPSQRPFVTVLVRTQGDRASLTDALTCLAAQTDSDFDVVVTVHVDAEDSAARTESVEATVATFAERFSARVRVLPVVGGGRSAPLNAGIAAASGEYLAFLDDDDVVTANWIEEYRLAAADAPGAVLRTMCVVQDHEHRSERAFDFEPVGGLVSMFSADFDFLEHRYFNQTPICAWALPARAARRYRLWFDDTLSVLEDWELLVRAASLFGVSSRQTHTSVYRRFVDGAGTTATFDEAFWADAELFIRNRLDALPALLPPGAIGQYAAVREGRNIAQAELREVTKELIATQEALNDRTLDRDSLSNDRDRIAGDLARRDLELVDVTAQLDVLERSRYWRALAPLRQLTARRSAVVSTLRRWTNRSD